MESQYEASGLPVTALKDTPKRSDRLARIRRRMSDAAEEDAEGEARQAKKIKRHTIGAHEPRQPAECDPLDFFGRDSPRPSSAEQATADLEGKIRLASINVAAHDDRFLASHEDVKSAERVVAAAQATLETAQRRLKAARDTRARRHETAQGALDAKVKLERLKAERENLVLRMKAIDEVVKKA